jgi:CheY-like chemotaxis protein
MRGIDPNQRRPILYAEDEENDVFFMQRAFQIAKISQRLDTVSDGAKAIEYLERAVSQGAEAIPCLVLLDLNMPYRSGFEVLEWVRSHPDLRTILVIVFTSSAQAEDRQRAYELCANAYLVKPSSPEKLPGMLESLKSFWLENNCFAPVRSREAAAVVV